MHLVVNRKGLILAGYLTTAEKRETACVTTLLVGAWRFLQTPEGQRAWRARRVIERTNRTLKADLQLEERLQAKEPWTAIKVGVQVWLTLIRYSVGRVLSLRRRRKGPGSSITGSYASGLGYIRSCASLSPPPPPPHPPLLHKSHSRTMIYEVQSMKMSDIVKQYQDEWVLIEYTKLDEQLNVEEGRVLAHSPRKEDIYALLPKFKGKNFSIEYTGEFPKDLAVMF